ncbi:MAG: hypothetical protein Q8M31_07775 [Beijerinckiaceae bacterium]|nr:hypothetical protein [Beijerinckiaceae bacterium]
MISATITLPKSAPYPGCDDLKPLRKTLKNVPGKVCENPFRTDNDISPKQPGYVSLFDLEIEIARFANNKSDLMSRCRANDVVASVGEGFKDPCQPYSVPCLLKAGQLFSNAQNPLRLATELFAG